MKLDQSKPLPEDILRGQGLPRIFLMQRGYINRLLEMGKFKPFPLRIDHKDDQVFLRELIGFFVEELIEAHEKYEEAALHILTTPESLIEMGKVNEAIESYNEELADAIHLLVEIMIVSNIDEEDVLSFYQKLMTEQNVLASFNSRCALTSALQYAIYINGREGITAARLHTKTMQKEQMNWMMVGGRSISANLLEMKKSLMFDIIVSINKAKNCLKNKFWKESKVETNVEQYQVLLMDTFIKMFMYLNLAGYTKAQEVFAIYFYKHQRVLQRLNEKY
jgi:hypothetical protein